jgi:hypothetical protein
MSTNPTTSEAQSTRQTTEIAARGRPDRWAAAGETRAAPPSAFAQRQFEPTARERLRNLTDGENAYCE